MIEKYAIVRNIQNDDLYYYQGNNKFMNIRTGKDGKVETEIAQKIFKINAEMTMLVNEHPIVLDLIRRLNLKYDFNNSKID